MLAASCSLAQEGAETPEEIVAGHGTGYYGYAAAYRVCAGFMLGIVFIVATEKILDNFGGEDARTDAISGIAGTVHVTMYARMVACTLAHLH